MTAVTAAGAESGHAARAVVLKDPPKYLPKRAGPSLHLHDTYGPARAIAALRRGLRCTERQRKPRTCKSFRKGEMIEFLAQMPTDTMIFLTMAVLSLAAILIVLTRLI